MRRLAPLLAALLLAAPSHGERLPVAWWTVGEGLPRDNVHSLFVDSRGATWVSTFEGIARMEGHAPATRVSEGLPEHRVSCVAEDVAGRLWVGTQAGLFRLDLEGALPGAPGEADAPWESLGTLHRNARRWTACAFDGTSTAPACYALLATPVGLLCGTETGLFRVVQPESDAPRLVPVPIGSPAGEGGIHALARGAGGTIWVGSESGLVRCDDGFNCGRVDLGADDEHDTVRALATTPDGSAFAAAPGALYAVKDGGPAGAASVARRWTKANGLPVDDIRALLVASDGTLWAGGQGGIAQLAPGSEEFLTRGASSGLTDELVLALAEDKAGNVWVGTEIGGLARIARNGLSSYGTAEGLSLTRIAATIEDRDGRTIAVDSAAGLNVFDGRGFTTVHPRLDREDVRAAWGWNQVAFQDSHRDWWIPTSRGVARWRDVRSLEELAARPPDQWITDREGLGGNNVFRVAEDAAGNLLVSTLSDNGRTLTRWVRDENRCEDVPPPPGQETSAPTLLRTAPDGSLWAGFYHGALARLRDGAWTVVRKDTEVRDDRIRDGMFDSQGRLWVAVESVGVVRIDEPASPSPSVSATWTADDGVSSDDVSCLAELRPGLVAFGTARGLDVLDVATGRFRRYGIADGLPNSYVNVAHVDGAGNLWLGTLEGVARLPPQRPDVAPPPPVRLVALSVDGASLPVSLAGETSVAGLVLRPGTRQVVLSATGLPSATGENLRYSHSLDGSPWSDPVAEDTLTLAGLTRGDHRIQVVAVSADGRRSTSPAVVELEMQRPQWQRPWFLALVAGMIGGAALLAHRERVQRLIELERVRTRIATDLHDDIGASLSQVAILSEIALRRTGADSPAATPLARIAAVTRELVDSMSDIVWAIDPHRDTLGDMVHRMRRFASDLVEERGVALTFTAPENLDDVHLGADVRRQVHLVFKESLNNAARHSRCRSVNVALEAARDELRLTVSDDGKGFAIGEATLGHGLTSMKRRAEALGGRLDIESAPGRGTTIRLMMPTRKRRRSA